MFSRLCSFRRITGNNGIAARITTESHLAMTDSCQHGVIVIVKVDVPGGDVGGAVVTTAHTRT